MKYMNPNSPEMKSKRSAIQSLMNMLGDKIMEDHEMMKSSKSGPMMEEEHGMAMMGMKKMPKDMMMMEEEMPDVDAGEVMGEASEEAMMDRQPMDMDMKEGDSHQEAPMDMNQVVHKMTMAEDDPSMDVQNPEIAMMLEKQMADSIDENAKYRPRMRNEEKGKMFITNKGSKMAGTVEPEPQQMLRKRKYR